MSLAPLDLRPNPKAMKKSPAEEKAVLKVTADIADSLVLKVESTPVLRRCIQCKELKPLTEFHRDNARTDGYYTRCIACVKLRKAEIKRRRDAGENIPSRKRVLSAVLPEQSTAPQPFTDQLLSTMNEAKLKQEATLARGEEIQRKIAMAEVMAAVSLLLGLGRESGDTVIRMVQAFYNTTEE